MAPNALFVVVAVDYTIEIVVLRVSVSVAILLHLLAELRNVQASSRLQSQFSIRIFLD